MTVSPAEVRIGENVYLNKSNFAESQLHKYADALESVFGELRGWRKRALEGGITVALAGPKEFRGTAAGTYRSREDVLYVRATPTVFKRAKGTYGSADYILVHEIGHRFDYKFKTPEDFDREFWHTTNYSTKENLSGSTEAFAELFALSNFGMLPGDVGREGIGGKWDLQKLERFDLLMAEYAWKAVARLPIPPHLLKFRGQ